MQRVILIWGFLVLCGISSFSWADPLLNVWGKQELILFDATQNQTPNSTERFGTLNLKEGLRRLQSHDFSNLKNFSANAELAWVTQEKSLVADAQNFIWPTDFSQEAQGWAGQGSQYVWRRQSSGQPTSLSLDLTATIAKQPFQFNYYDELWIDYTPTLGVNQCGMQLQFQALLQPYDKKKPPKTFTANTLDKVNLKVLEMLDASHAAFKARDYSYLMGRVLGLAPDEDWRFVQDKKNTVVQQRMHLKLDNVNALEIAFAEGAGVERINLLVSRKDSHGGGELLEFGGLSPLATLADGRSGVRLDLHNALAQRFPREWEENSKQVKTNHFYLQEVFLFFPGDAQTVVASKPVRKLTVLGLAKDAQTLWQASPYANSLYWVDEGSQKSLTLTDSVMGINASRQRLAVDIRKLSTMTDVDLAKANLILYPPEAAASCAVRIDEIRAVRIYNDQVPTFAENLEGWVRSRGGPFVQMLPKQGQVEQPGILNFLPLTAFSLVKNAKLKTQKHLPSEPPEIALEIKPIGANVSIPYFRVLTEAGKDVALENRRISISNGATLAFKGSEPTVSRDGDSLVLNGDSDSLEITWPMATRLFENTWFYFGVKEGAEQLAYMSLTAEFADGHQILRRVEPNKPLRIDSGGALLTKLRLSLALSAKPYRVKLRELAIFSPKIATYGEARMLALPFAMNVKLKPSLTEGTQRLMESAPGYVTGLLGNKAVRFVTSLDKPLDWVQGFNLGFRFPLGLANEGKCPLTMQLNWTGGHTLRQFCPENMEGSIFLPLANLLGAENQGRNLGALKSIEWIVKASDSRIGGVQEAFSLNFSVEGWAMVSAMDQIRLSPLFKAGKEDVYAEMPKLENALSSFYSKRFWLPLGTATLDNIAAIEGEILPAKHPLFTLNKIVAEPNQPIDLTRWVNLPDPPALNASPLWTKLLLLVSIIALVWAAWKKRWWSMGGLGCISLGMGKVLFGLARFTIQGLIRLLWRLLPWLNLMVGVFALVPGLWLVGRLGASIQGAMVLSGLVLVLWGVCSHLRGGTSHIWLEKGWIALTLSAGCAALSFGNFGLQYGAAWGLLPLMGTIYALLPMIYQRLLLWWKDKRHLFLLSVWAALTLLLYVIGLILKMGSDEKYFFTLGGMTMVMVVRELFLVVKPRFRKAFPNIANLVYGGVGSLYFSGAVVLLVGTATMLSLKLEPIAERLAVVAYYCLVVGTVLEVVALQRNHRDHSANKETLVAHPIETTSK
jgi:hypothetical protein